MSVSFGCLRFIDSYRFSSSSLDKLTNSFIEIKHKSLEILQEHFLDTEIILDIYKESELFITNDKYGNESIEIFFSKKNSQIKYKN